LKQHSIGQSDLRRQIAWDLTWPKYLAQYITEARLAEYFQAHRREFDGTQLAVSHILLQPEAGAAAESMDELVRQAEAIRRSIAADETTFAEAAREHSAGPSAREDGRLGFIRRHGSMAETFSRAAFALQPGQISPPVTSRFGVHLIRCDEIKPGTQTLADAQGPLRKALARELIEKLAEHERRRTAVKYTGACPYFKPGTRELVLP